jgi:hypothetical protein
MFKHTMIRRSLIAGLAIGAAALPTAAQARFIAGKPVTTTHSVAQVVNAAPQPPSSSARSGFEWGDAGIGAAGALALVGIGSGVVAVRRRRMGPLAR